MAIYYPEFLFSEKSKFLYKSDHINRLDILSVDILSGVYCNRLDILPEVFIQPKIQLPL